MNTAYDELESPEDKEEARDLALLASNIMAWAGPNNTTFDVALATAWGYLNQAAAFVDNLPVLTSLEPSSLEVPGQDAEVTFRGTGFTAATVINWNGGDEQTDFISETEVRTTVKPSTVEAPLPFTLEAYVHNGGVASNSLPFTFTELLGRKNR